jgi:hypothetical protein
VSAQGGSSRSVSAPSATVNPRANVILTLAGIGLTLIVLATLVGVVIVKRGMAFQSHDAHPTPVILSAANAKVPDPFTSPATTPIPPVSQDAVAQIQALVGQLPLAADRGVRLVSGAHPGLYAGAAEARSCDAAQLANELVGRPERARAWAELLDVGPPRIAFYLDSLTPVTLTVDTWVTSHGFRDGRTTTQQSVLQAGSAVLIDPAGVPRVLCGGGNPLQPPIDTNFSTLPPTGQRWPGYDPQSVVAIAYSDAPSSFADPVPTAAIDEFKLVDPTSGALVIRKAGGTIELGQSDLDGTSLPDPIGANVAPPIAAATGPVGTTPTPP